jgi:hypothetical protein
MAIIIRDILAVVGKVQKLKTVHHFMEIYIFRVYLAPEEQN